MKKCLLSFAACLSLLAMSCGGGAEKQPASTEQKKTNELLATSKKNSEEVEKLNEEYREVPDERMLNNGGQNSPVYKELQQRYKTQLGAMKQSVEATGAKFVVMIITPEVGQNISALTRYGHPFIKQACNDLGVEVYDLSPVISQQDAKVITQVPRDGHWSKKGAEFLANQIDPILVKYAGHKSTTTFKDGERPETFGDLAPSYEEILDGGKDLPYKVTSNAQGLRMDHDVKFPKTKQHILFLGGSQFFSPFLDNEFIATSLLQKKHPEMELMNAAMIAGCTDDFTSLWEDKARFSEADVVIMQTNGTDITDLFFTNRNHLARSKKPYYPTPVEEQYFKETYRK